MATSTANATITNTVIDESPSNLTSTTTTNPTTTTSTTTNGIPTLYHLSDSQSLRTLWALEELAAAHGQPYALKIFKRQKGRAPPELQAIFPLGNSPILVIEHEKRRDAKDTSKGGEGGGGGNGEQYIHITTPGVNKDTNNPSRNKVITESRLILQYLTEHYSHGIWDPTTEASRQRNEYFQEFATASLAQKVDFVMLFDVLPPHVPFVIRPLVRAFCNAVAGMYKEMLVRPFRLMEESLAGAAADGKGESDEGRRWFAGERMGQADILMSWPMDMAVQRGYFDRKLYPRVAEWYARVTTRPAYKRALEKGGEYDLVTFGF